jgi:hypothetical protein
MPFWTSITRSAVRARVVTEIPQFRRKYDSQSYRRLIGPRCAPEPFFRALISLPESGRPSVKLRVAMRSMGRLDEIASDATSSRIGRASQLFVARQTRLHGVEFCAYQRERVAADQQVLWRLRHVHQSEDRRRSPVRIA